MSTGQWSGEFGTYGEFCGGNSWPHTHNHQRNYSHLDQWQLPEKWSRKIWVWGGQVFDEQYKPSIQPSGSHFNSNVLCFLLHMENKSFPLNNLRVIMLWLCVLDVSELSLEPFGHILMKLSEINQSAYIYSTTNTFLKSTKFMMDATNNQPYFSHKWLWSIQEVLS